jgi:hypothetical protein
MRRKLAAAKLGGMSKAALQYIWRTKRSSH